MEGREYMAQPEADKLLITPDDTMEEINGRCYELLRAALAEATRNGIKANSIVINKNMVRVPESFGQWPEMICGLHCFFTADELPDGYAFSIQHAPEKKITNGDHIRSMTDEELAERMVSFHRTFGVYFMRGEIFSTKKEALEKALEWLRSEVSAP